MDWVDPDYLWDCLASPPPPPRLAYVILSFLLDLSHEKGSGQHSTSHSTAKCIAEISNVDGVTICALVK